MHPRKLTGIVFGNALGLTIAATPVAAASIARFSLEELMTMEITSSSKKAEALSQADSAVFVITQEDLRRSGVTTIPEALRMVPGVEAQRIDANKWAISSRGFNGRFSNKLLVLMDGRTIYSPSFSGVFWEVQDYPLEDIERIEVIRGPGATLWGANAVNGVINIVTKSAADTLGGLTTVLAGGEERFATLRYGGQLGEDAHLRVYGKALGRDGSTGYVSGDEKDDGADIGQAGFRMDWQAARRDSLTVQGDIFDGDITQVYDEVVLTPPQFRQEREDETAYRGGNLLGRWKRVLSDRSDLALQAYFDNFIYRGYTLEQEVETFDLDFQHHLGLGRRHDVVWGLGVRHINDRFRDSQPLGINFTNYSRGTDLVSAFLQDEITLVEDLLKMKLGTKIEHNDYTGSEVQPSARLSWTPAKEHTLWASVSRAVRTPSRGDSDFQIAVFATPGFGFPGAPPNVFTVSGNEQYDSEDMLGYEVGYRTQPKENLFLDASVFVNRYDNLQTQELSFANARNMGTYILVPFTTDNKADGEAYGFELAATWRPLDWWEWKLAYNRMEMQLHRDPDSLDTAVEDMEQGSPHNNLSLRSLMDLGRNWELDCWLRYTDTVPVPGSYARSLGIGVPSYVSLDLRLGWKATERLELALVGKNLLDARHLESVGEDSIPMEIARTVYGKATWRF
ncbi:MAG: TonB-dependent receptor plug domain-containing protein [Thermodesulfobacteriota bacterium]